MLTLFRKCERRDLWAEGPAFVVAFVCAEFFFKFRSFSLECVAFLATWVALSAVVHLLMRPAPEPAKASC